MIGDIAGMATALAVLIAATGVFAQSRTRKFSLAQVYVQRYWQIDDDLPPDGSLNHDSANVRRYLRLCEDEFDAARQGWIDVAVWRDWHDSILPRLRKLDLEHVRNFEQLKLCREQRQRDHKATKCEGLRKVRWRQRIWWWLEDPFGD